jgi:hypothetical protein
MARRGRRADSFRASDPDARIILNEVLCLSAVTMVYTPDEVFLPGKSRKFMKAAIESFDYARVRLGGDCEDLALEILLCVSEMLHKLARAPDHISRLQQLAGEYVYGMVLGGVSSAEINGSYGQLKEMGAHMWATGIHRKQFFRWWKRGNGNGHRDVERELARDAGETVPPPMILEGTGMLREQSSPNAGDEEDAAREQLEEYGQPTTFAGMQRWFNYTRGIRSMFYHTLTLFMTNHFLISGSDTPGHVCFAVCQQQQQRRQQQQGLTVGVEFTDFTLGDPNNKIVFLSESELGTEELDCIRDSVKDLHPIPGLRVPSTQPASELDKLLASQEFGPPDAAGIRVEYLARRQLLVGGDKCAMLGQAFVLARQAGFALSVRWLREEPCEGLLSYRLVVICRK